MRTRHRPTWPGSEPSTSRASRPAPNTPTGPSSTPRSTSPKTWSTRPSSGPTHSATTPTGSDASSPSCPARPGARTGCSTASSPRRPSHDLVPGHGAREGPPAQPASATPAGAASSRATGPAKPSPTTGSTAATGSAPSPPASSTTTTRHRRPGPNGQAPLPVHGRPPRRPRRATTRPTASCDPSHARQRARLALRIARDGPTATDVRQHPATPARAA